MIEFLALNYESTYDFLLNSYIIWELNNLLKDKLVCSLFGRFSNLKMINFWIQTENKYKNVESQRNKLFIKPTIHFVLTKTI